MTDRELLEKAAKAAGYDVRWHEVWQCFVHKGPFNIDNPPTLAGQRMVWVPLHDDGDALRLAVKRRIHIQPSATAPGCLPSVECYLAEDPHSEVVEEVLGTDPAAATRRAIVRAAASVAP